MKHEREGPQAIAPGDPGVARADVLRAEPPTSATRNVGWLRPALGLAAVLAALVALPRLLPASADEPTASPRATAAATHHNPVAARPTLTVAADGGPAVGAPLPRSTDGSEYLDGIPTNVAGEAVLRVRDALLQPLGTRLLVGGWYLPPVCHDGHAGRVGCASAVLSDVPVDQQGPGWLTTDWLAVSSQLSGMGSRILRGQLEPDPACSISQAIACQPRLVVTNVVWIGSPAAD